ncbi:MULTISPECIES: BTAD domain-containing putative transcriptional regulator [Actinomadura]|uniref:BTAD domain-containing putative transcriptional regulator n=1 Tax=Actinomadura yumaensis TaxID=111807 RepID=A0ABW2CVK5_9ACTN|nr:BTAD domain-containing putative transcriptional regulator [Actinomadura sp. J1-007]MWK37642.1 AfsR family transcriptional regulator [Actinomadura sp. J1-007]
MRIGILGPLEVAPDGPSGAADGGRVEIGGARLRALLTLLALEPGRLVSAERIIGDLWEDRAPAAAPNALQSLVSRLRAAIGRERVESRAGAYRLDVPASAIDAHDFEARVVRARRTADPAARSAELREALALWRGPALADAAGLPFAEGPAARLEGLRRGAVEERVDADLALGRHAELIPELQALAAADPLREPVRGRLIRALYGAGRQADALAEYDAVRAELAEALGVDPSRDLEELRLAVLRQDPCLLPPRPAPSPAVAAVPAPSGAAARSTGSGASAADGLSGAPEPGAAASAAGPRGNLRARLTSFIGRDDDLRAVGELLGNGRLVTLTGPGGAGKTRLSQEAAGRRGETAPDGAWFVELAPVLDPAELPPTLLTVLGLNETALVAAPLGRLPAAEPADPLERLVSALAGRRLLLVLDNCEHLLDAAARVADRVLAACPGVRILATSREPLGITGESLWPVEPLALPPPAASAAEAARYPAVRLFADRAAAVSPGFEVTDANVAWVVQICRALDGMPLAIELAAARLRAMTPGQVADRLEDRFRLLNAGSRTALPRHQTLRAVVEWSWDLLDGAERALWRRLAVFVGGATTEAAEEVCAGPELDRSDVMDVLTALVDKSLVVVREGEDGLAGEPRYAMLETIRAYGLERLAEAGEEERLRRAHAAYFVELAETAEPHLYRAGQLRWLDRLTAEHDNTHSALRFAVAAGDAALAVRFCAALGWYWFLRGQHNEGAEHLVEIAAMPGLPEDETTAVALGIGAMATLDGPHHLETAGAWLRRTRDICAMLRPEALHPVLRMLSATLIMYLEGWEDGTPPSLEALLDDPDPWVRGVAHFVRGQLGINFGWTGELERDFSEALAAFREAGDRWGLSFTLAGQAEVVGRTGRHAESVALYEEALRLNAELGGGSVVLLHVHMKLANALDLAGRRERAEAFLAESLREAERRGQPEEIAAIHYQLGEFARRAGDRATAARRLGRAEDLMANAGGPPQFRSMVLASRAQLDLDLGETAAARGRLDEAMRGAVRARDYPIVAYVLAGFADLARREDDPERAAGLLGTADALRGIRDLSLPDVAAIHDDVRDRLGEPAFTAAYERGAAVTFDQLVDRFGLERPAPMSIKPSPPPPAA